MRRLAILSMHTSPLVQPGTGDGGGMNVYVREVVSALAQAGGQPTVFTRRTDGCTPDVVTLDSGVEVVQVDAGDPSLPKEHLAGIVDRFADGVAGHLEDGGFDGIFANYWLSAQAGHRLKHDLDLPLATVFHTLGRVKAQTGDTEPRERMEAEQAVVRCSDVILANSCEEVRQLVHLYDADPDRIEVVPPGVDHTRFTPGDQDEARAALGEVVVLKNHLHLCTVAVGLVTHGLNVGLHVGPVAGERLADVDDHIDLNRAVPAGQLGFVAFGFGA